MKQLVLKHTFKTKRGYTHKIVTLPQSFITNLTIEDTGSVILEFRDKNGELIHFVRFVEPKGFPKCFDKLPKEFKKELEAETARYINYDLTYFLAHEKYWCERDLGIKNDESGVFDLDVKLNDWFTAMCIYIVKSAGLPIII